METQPQPQPQPQQFCEQNKEERKEDKGKNKKDTSDNNMLVVKSTRWTPRAGQIQILEDLYHKMGVRSLSPEQTQWILPILRQFGRIEGKNVFYWFQNYKAREKQMRNRCGRHYAATTNRAASRRVSSLYNNNFLDHKMKSFDEIQKENLMPSQQRQEKEEEGGDDEKHPKLKILPLFPMHDNSVSTSFCTHASYNALTSDSQVSLELSLNLYNRFN